MIMNKRYYFILLFFLVLSACTNRELDIDIPQSGTGDSSINPSCNGYWMQGGLPVTKALVNNKTTVSLDANFLRIDEETQDYSVNYQFDYNQGYATNWEKSYIIEGTVISSPDREGRRSIYLNPVQAYKLTSDGSENNKIFHHTRMVGWYPKTCELIKDGDDKAAITMFNSYKNSLGADKVYKAENDSVFIKFENLNGEKDIMVSDMIEAQQYHLDTDTGIIPCGKAGVSPGPHRQPFGYNESGPTYDNTFQYKHYMSAVRIFGYSEENTAQVISMWGHIRKVVVADQPSTCYVGLPMTLEGTTNRSAHTKKAKFDGTCNFDIVKTEIFGGDPNSSDPEDHLVAPDNPTLEGYDKDNMLYLGYALIAPDYAGYDLKLDVHTDSGIYRVTIDNANFKAGTIHTLHLKFETTGSIAAIVLDDASGVYYDLTTGETFDVAGVNVIAYKYANCYVIHSGIKYDSDNNGVADKLYDGFCFSATKVGNGIQYSGFYPESVEINPVRAGLIWEEIEGTITDVSLMYGYVRFKCSAYDKGSKPCNAVVGVFDKYGKVLWSWHIWITHDSPKLVDFNVGSTTVSIMNRNLGSSVYYPDTDTNWSTAAEDAVLGTYGMYYQWGRKDPSMMPPSSDYRPMSTETAVYYDAYAFENNSWNLMLLAQPTMQDAIENPAALILSSSIAIGYKYDWLYNSSNNLWSYGSDGLKTIYDPCPYGYKMPNSEIDALFSASTYVGTITDGGSEMSNSDGHIRTYILNSSNLGEKPVGMYVNQGTHNVFFPFSGYKGVDRGMSSLTCAWKYVGEKGDYMSSSVMSNGHRSRVYLSAATSWEETGADGGSANYSASGHYVLDETNKKTAGSVRCVKDDAFATISIEMTLDKDFYVVGGYAKISYTVRTVGVKDDLLNNLGFSIDYEYVDDQGVIISDKTSTDGNHSPSGNITLSSDKSGTTIVEIWEFESQPKFLKINFIVKNQGETRSSKTMLIPISSGWDADQRYEATGNAGYGSDVQTTLGINMTDPFIFTFRYAKSSFMHPSEPFDNSIIVEENSNPETAFLKSCFFYLEDLTIPPATAKSNYTNQATCYMKVFRDVDGKKVAYYLKRTGSGVSLTANKSEATLMYICSDWDGGAQDYVDLIDADGNYLYYNRGQKRLQFDKSFASNLYQWYIHKGIE